MELIEINKTEKNKAEITLKIADSMKKYEFTYSVGEIFSADFPGELRKILRLLPVPITHSLVGKIENFLTSKHVSLPFELEIEKEILQMV